MDVVVVTTTTMIMTALGLHQGRMLLSTMLRGMAGRKRALSTTVMWAPRRARSLPLRPARVQTLRLLRHG